MSVATSGSKVTYQGNGATTVWPFSFTVLEKAHLQVILTSAAGAETTLTSDYTVDLDTKRVTYPGYVAGQEPPAAQQPPVLPTGSYITLLRVVPYTQETDLGDRWPFSEIENMSDRTTMQVQQLAEEMSRTVKVPIVHNVTPDQLLNSIEQSEANAATSATAAQTAQADAQAAKEAAEALALQDYGGTMKIADIITKGPWVDVRAFGAKCDGVTDDTEALKEAFDAGLNIYLPAGAYVTTKPLIVRNCMHLYGPGAKIIKTGSGTLTGYPTITDSSGNPVDYNVDAILVLADNYNTHINPTQSNFLTGVRMSKIDLEGTSSTIGIFSPCSQYLTFEAVSIYNVKKGVVLANTWVTKLDHVIVTQAVEECFKIGSYLANVGGTSTKITNCFANYGAVGYELQSMHYSSIDTCACDHTSIAYKLSDCRGVGIVSCGAEDTNGPKWMIINSEKTTIMGNDAWINSALTGSGDYAKHFIVRSSSVLFANNNFTVKYGVAAPTTYEVTNSNVTFIANNFGGIDPEKVTSLTLYNANGNAVVVPCFGYFRRNSAGRVDFELDVLVGENVANKTSYISGLTGQVGFFKPYNPGNSRAFSGVRRFDLSTQIGYTPKNLFAQDAGDTIRLEADGGGGLVYYRYEDLITAVNASTSNVISIAGYYHVVDC